MYNCCRKSYSLIYSFCKVCKVLGEIKPRMNLVSQVSGMRRDSVYIMKQDTAEIRIDVTSVGQRKYVFDVTSIGQRKYVFDVTSIGQRSSPWTCKLSESGDKFHLECKLHFRSVMLRQIHLTNVSECIEAKYWVSCTCVVPVHTWLMLVLMLVLASYV